MELNQVTTTYDTDITIIEQDNKYYALNGWNGEEYGDCWETDSKGYTIGSKVKYEIRPIYDWDNCPKDEDGEYDVNELQQIEWDIREV